MPETPFEEFRALVGSIPPGRCASYGALGRALSHPVSGLLAGRWAARLPEGAPWWRVVGKNGELRSARRDPALAETQARLLRAEGVRFHPDGRANMARAWEPGG